MPTTINGIGTHYVGKKNLSQREAACEHCGRQATLSSYDTRLFFVFVFIPIIPLGRKRVLDQCSRCSRHAAMPLAAHTQLQSETLEELAAAHAREPENVDAAVEYNAALFQFDRPEEGLKHLGKVVAAFPDNVDVLFYAGGVLERLGRPEEATRYFARAYEIDPRNPAVRRAKAIQHIEEGNPHAAYSLLKDTPVGERDPAVLFLLAKAYQERSDHHTALEVFRLLLQDQPALGQDKHVRKAVAASEKRVQQPSSLLPARSLPWAKIGLAAALVALLVVAPLAVSAYQKSHFKLHVVNGYPGAVKVVLDGEQEIAFDGPRRRVVEIAEGAHRAEVVEPWQEEIDFTVTRGFFERFGDGPVAVLNPGGLAILMWEETLYSEHPVDDYEPVVKLFAGQGFRSFKRIDFPFKEFPEEVELSSGKSRVRKNRLSEMFADPAEAYVWFLGTGNAAGGLDYLESWIRIAPADELAEAYATAALMADARPRAVDFLRDRRTLKPVNVEWHRAYQRVTEPAERARPELIREYAGYLENDPGSSALSYLRGRIEPDPEQAQVFYARALAADAGNRHAARASGMNLMSRGRFGAAADVFSGAVERHADDAELARMYHDSLLAAGRLDTVEGTLRSRLGDEVATLDWIAAKQLVHALLRRGETAQADAWIRRLGELDAALPEEQKTLIEPWLRCRFFYVTESWKALEGEIMQPDFPSAWRDEAAFWLAVEKGEVEGLNPVEQDGFRKLLIGLVHARDDRPELMATRVEEALAELAPVDESYQVFQGLWSGELAVTPAHLDRILTTPEVKAVLLTVLAARHGEHRRRLLEEAGKYNYSLDFPHHLLASFQSGESS